jgi:hypothetical protein
VIYLLWAILCTGLGILFALVIRIVQSWRLAKAAEMQINALGETHMVGFALLNGELQKLEKRLKELEDEVL